MEREIFRKAEDFRKEVLDGRPLPGRIAAIQTEMLLVILERLEELENPELLKS